MAWAREDLYPCAPAAPEVHDRQKPIGAVTYRSVYMSDLASLMLSNMQEQLCNITEPRAISSYQIQLVKPKTVAEGT